MNIPGVPPSEISHIIFRIISHIVFDNDLMFDRYIISKLKKMIPRAMINKHCLKRRYITTILLLSMLHFTD